MAMKRKPSAVDNTTVDVPGECQMTGAFKQFDHDSISIVDKKNTGRLIEQQTVKMAVFNICRLNTTNYLI